MGIGVTPSKSCEPCRVKRRRCDFREPSCSQCLRAAVQCPGYKDAFTLLLRDETLLTAHKAQTRKSRANSRSRKSRMPDLDLASDCHAAKIPLSPADTYNEVPGCHGGADDDHENIDGDHHVYSEPKLLATIRPAFLQDQAALSFFMHTYATHSYFHYFPRFYDALKHDAINSGPMLTPGDGIDLEQAISAAGLVLLSQELRQPSLLGAASIRYAAVLATTQKALSDPGRATLDSTLASILLLSLVEALSFRGRHDPSGFDAHTLGAATLLQIRGTEQVQSELGRELYQHASGIIRQRCAMRSIEVPFVIKQLTQRMKETCKSISTVPTFQLRTSTVMEQFACLRADMNSGSLSHSEQLRRVCAIGIDLDELFTTIQQNEPYLTVSVSLPSAVFTTEIAGFCANRGVSHIYQSPRIAKRWNDLRLLRLYLGEYVPDSLLATNGACCDSDDSPNSTLVISDEEATCAAQTIRLAREAAIDILHSVAYTLHLSSAPRILANTLVLPLSSIAVSEVLPYALRIFARDRLHYIGDKFGIVQATEAWYMVQEMENLEWWTTTSHSL